MNTPTVVAEPKPKKPRGGRRPGAGRKPGPAWFGKQTYRAMSLRQRFPIMPLELMLCVVNNLDPDSPEPKRKTFTLEKRCDMAARCAPYLHPRLANVNLQARQKYSIDLDKLDDQELAAFEKLLLKSQVLEGMQSPEEVASDVINGDYELLPPGANNGGTSH
jgi:hypothetical protein